MAYDWVAIKREWATGRYPTVRAFERSLKSDERFMGNSPSHVMISRVMKQDAEAGEPWEKNLQPQVDELVQRQLAVLGTSSPNEREAIEEAAAIRVSAIARHQGLARRAREQFERAVNILEQRLKFEEDKLRISRLPPTMEQCRELMDLYHAMGRAENQLMDAERKALGLEGKQEDNKQPERAGADDELIRRNRNNRERASALAGKLLAIGPAALGGSSSGDDRPAIAG